MARAKEYGVSSSALTGEKRAQHSRAISSSGGKATAQYTDEELVATFKRYKARCGKLSLTSAIANMLDEASGKEYLRYSSAAPIWKRLRTITRPKAPAQWWKTL